MLTTRPTVKHPRRCVADPRKVAALNQIREEVRPGGERKRLLEGAVRVISQETGQGHPSPAAFKYFGIVLIHRVVSIPEFILQKH